MGGDDEDRLGGGGKEDKGNVVVSVRVRPDGDDGIPPEWVINGRDSKLTYHGREGGEYSYGKKEHILVGLRGSMRRLLMRGLALSRQRFHT